MKGRDWQLKKRTPEGAGGGRYLIENEGDIRESGQELELSLVSY
jgi:hypothetical protein